MSPDFPDHEAQRLAQAQRMARLITGFLRDTLTGAERTELDEWVGADDANMQLFEELTDEKNLRQAMDLMRKLEAGAALPVIRPRRRYGWWTAAAAAAVVIGLIINIVYWTGGDRQPKKEVAATFMQDTVTDIQPGTARAVLIAGAQTLILGVRDTVLALDAGLRATDDNHILRYTAAARETAPQNHTLQTPAGGEYQLQLPDGTKVWLNAASSITYPTVFTGESRQVSLSGEAYFEVAHSRQPFIVNTPQASVKVLGTHFNTNVYPENTSSVTTLLEGSVEINQGKTVKRLVPGQQAIATFNNLSIADDIETDDIIAWKNGLFAFKEDSIAKVMQQLARWYGLQVSYQGAVTETFTGRIKRSSTLSQSLRILELVGRVTFTVEGHNVQVQPK